MTELRAAQRDLRCYAGQRQFQSAWDRAVDSGMDERDADMLDQMEAATELACRAA